jgi:hypothetical protein
MLKETFALKMVLMISFKGFIHVIHIICSKFHINVKWMYHTLGLDQVCYFDENKYVFFNSANFYSNECLDRF